MICTQPSLFKVEPDDPAIGRLVSLLDERGWLTREQIGELLDWTERHIRAVAEAAPQLIVRGQRGFNTVRGASADELSACAGPFESQGKKMLAAALVWRQAAHQKIR